jgi:CRP-like cAMP-binding protein
MDAPEKLNQLKSLALLGHLSEAKLAELSQFLGVQSLAAEEVVFEEGSTGDTLFFVAEGEIRIEKKVEAGGFKELALLSPGDFFGEMALIEETPRSARAVALNDTTLFALGRQDLERWLQSDARMAVGFFVELLRVFSQRLRGTSAQLVLLYDLSLLTLQEFEDETAFLHAAIDRVLTHLPGEWSCAAYISAPYSGDLSRVALHGPGSEALPESLDARDSESRWLDDTSFRVALPGAGETPLGFLVAHNGSLMSPRERSGFAVALTAAAHLLASAVQNIRHDTEERLRARLQHQRAHEGAF